MGWREFIRGVYWTEGEDYAERNALEEHGSLPEWYWTGETDLACLRDAIGQVVEFGYGHHIQRLMITGNFALIAGINPRRVSDWYLAMFVDAIDWVTLPNALGMVMHADGGVVGTKPYAASANYIGKMSNHCKGCRWNRKARHGDDACPFNVFYWDFLIRHRERLRGNRRMAIPLKNVDRLDPGERDAITATATDLRARLGITVT
jgi:deoxyribodipyrimidine photolyase-related protein